MKNKFINEKQNNGKGAGFTILEVIGAIFVIVLGLIGIMSLVLQNIQVQYINKNNLIASQLAQEGLELVRNIRDYNWLVGNDWDNEISPGTYKIDYTGLITSVTDISEAKLQLRDDASLGFYWHEATDPDTIFSRLITITQSSSELLEVSGLIQWTDKFGVREYTAETILYNWR